MCFSFGVSLATGVVSWVVSITVLLKCHALRAEATHLLLFSSMQFADALLWRSKFERNSLNAATTSFLVPLLLSAQLLYNAFRVDHTLAYIAAAAYSVYIFVRSHGTYSTAACGRWGSPVWAGHELSRMELWVFVVLVTLPKWHLTVGGIVFVEVVRRLVCGGFGSMWCALACVFSVVLSVKCASQR